MFCRTGNKLYRKGNRARLKQFIAKMAWTLALAEIATTKVGIVAAAIMNILFTLGFLRENG